MKKQSSSAYNATRRKTFINKRKESLLAAHVKKRLETTSIIHSLLCYECFEEILPIFFFSSEENYIQCLDDVTSE